jgi:hypothetical protein
MQAVVYRGSGKGFEEFKGFKEFELLCGVGSSRFFDRDGAIEPR